MISADPFYKNTTMQRPLSHMFGHATKVPTKSGHRLDQFIEFLVILIAYAIRKVIGKGLQ